VCNSESELVTAFLHRTNEDKLSLGDYYLYESTMFIFTGATISVILKEDNIIDTKTQKLIDIINYNFRKKKPQIIYNSILEENKQIESILNSISEIRKLDNLIESCSYQFILL